MKKIVTVVGARPQFIKAATVSRALRGSSELSEIVIHTGQHYDANLSDIFFDELEMSDPNYNLNIGSGNHGAQTGRMLEEIEKILIQEQPRWLLVYGDTNSTLAGALAAAKLHIPIAHVEAGLRSFNREMPEEVNRVLTDQMSSVLFTPTSDASKNLKKEGIAETQIAEVGDVMFDAALIFGERAEKQSEILMRFKLNSKHYILTTIHRAENTDSEARMRVIVESLFKISKQIQIVFPLHPRTRRILERMGLIEEVESQLCVVPPVGYLDMLKLQRNAKIIVTDSGGIQKEAYFQSVPCVTLRDETEWVELVSSGWNHLASPICKIAIERVVFDVLLSTPPEKHENFYGDGRASEKIARELVFRCFS